MSRVRCFLSEPSPFADESLRRFAWSEKGGCPGPYGGHDAEVSLGEVSCAEGQSGRRDDLDHQDPRWPAKCDHCDYLFGAADQWQHVLERKYVRVDTGERFTLRNPPPGAMWNADWMGNFHKGPDGRCLVVVLPNGHQWMVDGRASNCTMPNDKTHKCWVRHGEPPEVTVDKNGPTCAAGAGSILAGNYHGFLRGGWLEEC